MGNKKYKTKTFRKISGRKNKLYSHLLIIWSTITILWLIVFLSANINWNIWNNEKQEFESASEKVVVWTLIDKKKDIVTEKAEKTLLNFYYNVNKADFSWYYSLFDKILRTNDSMRTYFSKTRINRFINKISWWIEVSNIEEISSYSKQSKYFIKKWFRYKLSYQIDWKTYLENWESILMSYDWWEKFYINSLFCTSNNCWKLPFYN